MVDTESTSQSSQGIEHWAMRMARSRAEVAMWDVNLVVFLFGVLAIVIILVSLDIDTNIVASAAFIGLIIVWIMVKRRSKRLIESLYAEELSDIRQEPTREAPALKEKLTSREIQILSYAAQGYANKRIALELGISVNTVKNFVSGVLAKLDASDRTEAVVIAIKHGIISIQ